MKPRYTFKNGQVTVKDNLYHQLTEPARKVSEVVVLLVIQKRKAEAENETNKR